MTSTTITVTCSVPQGSVLGPLFFISYTADHSELADKHGVTLNAFADETQLYLHCNSNITASATSTLESCIAEVSRSMSANRFKLNDDKTKLLWTGSDHSIRKLSGNGPSVTLGTDIINASADAYCLGGTITPDLQLAKHASIVSGKCFFSYVNFNVFVAHSKRTWLPHSFTRSLKDV